MSEENKTINCPNCSKELPADGKFCPYCGAPTSGNYQPMYPQPQPPYQYPPQYGYPVPPPKEPEFYEQVFLHESDRKALKALKAIPGFSIVMKKFIKVFNEKQWRIVNLSSNIRISEEQMPEIYNMLPPICEKLKIDVPEIYLELDVIPNAYTYGDTNPFIVITSGLLETIPMELLPTVIAHECGHIACHHTLYTTIARILVSGAGLAGEAYGLGKLVSYPLQIALYHWMRCSELSADRAAAYCDGTSEKIVEMCMRFAGFDKNLDLTVSQELFMNQAKDYKDMINSSSWDKTLEFFILSKMDHPFNSVRALECHEWAESDEFKNYVNQQA